MQTDMTPDELTDRVRTIWTEVLGRSDFSDSDSFFESGGHSLLASKVMARLGRSVGVRLSMQLIFDHRTVEQLAGAVYAQVSAQNTTARPETTTA
ncbi:phosphopantetheine-binding protein [Streptomyces sp. NBC_01233]|uniref:phosphopantetheine-binding protein n=1 Tax=Streptomyces sp. NBC_01233 TaxID=2903787 RepID=UPI002E160388|nr:phosphopantetheine-binding protein [Streptomyces sp. NBC_01233]